MIQTSKIYQGQQKKKQSQSDCQKQLFHIFIGYDYLYLMKIINPQILLQIDRKSGESIFVKLTDQKLVELSSIKKKSKIVFKQVEFLVLISKAIQCGEMFKKPIYQVLSVQFLTIKRIDYESKLYEKCYTPIYKLKTFLKQGFYFSYQYNLHELVDKELLGQSKPYKASQNIYIWNIQPIRSLFSQILTTNFFIPLIQGYYGQIKSLDESQYILISRRSYMMGGTRYNSRGIDNNGYVANYVESEMILIKGNQIKSHVQIRGSLPFHWKQIGVQAKIVIHQTYQQNLNAMRKHLQMISHRYNQKSIVFFNLLGLNRGDENKLSDYLIDLIGDLRREENSEIKYVHVDFHGITKETDFSALDEYVYNLCSNSNYNYYMQNEQNNWEQVSKQNDIVRTNCMDCLDRTNAAQTKIAQIFLHLFLKDWEYDFFEDNFLLYKPLVYFQKTNNGLVQQIRKIWADNGDIISKIYAGTGATTSSVTRKGKNTGITSIFDHGIKTISRFYLNNFEDDFKQEIIDQMLNKKQTSIRQSILHIDEQKNKIFKIGLVSLLSDKQHEMLEIQLDLITQLFKSFHECEFVLFFFYNHNQTNVKIQTKEYQVYENFKVIFETFSPVLDNFIIFSYLNSNNFEAFLLGKQKTKGNFQYYNDERVKIKRFSTTSFIKLSFILNKTSIIVFPIILDKGKTKNEKIIKKLLEKFMDKFYDLIFIIGNVDENVDLNDSHKNYDHIYEVTVISKNETLNNQISILCSKKLILEEMKPMQGNQEIEEIELQSNFTINTKQFVLFGHDNQLLLSKFLNSSITVSYCS